MHGTRLTFNYAQHLEQSLRKSKPDFSTLFCILYLSNPVVTIKKKDGREAPETFPKTVKKKETQPTNLKQTDMTLYHISILCAYYIVLLTSLP